MHTIKILAAGIALLGVCLLVGRAIGGARGAAVAAIVFLPLWIVGAGVNMYIGVKRAGYSIADETPIFAIVFIIPAAAALLSWWKIR
jgi:hypothetical protein